LDRHAEAAAAAHQARKLARSTRGIMRYPRRWRSTLTIIRRAVQFARRATVLDPEFWVGHFELWQACEPVDKRVWRLKL